MAKQLKCLLVDDEPPALRVLSKFVEQVAFLSVHSQVHDPIKALAIVESEDIDVVFLDIEMSQLSGLQLAKIIGKKVDIIFTTAYPQFALESYESNAVDYLLKPFTFERFYEAVVKLTVSNESKVEIKRGFEDYMFVKTDGKNNFERVLIKDICYVEASRNYITIHLTNRKLVTYSTLKHTESCLPKKQFIRIHKSFIISLAHLDKTESHDVFVNGNILPIGETYKESLFKRINQSKL